ncbi:MAG: hypothetical protein Q9M50_10465 [Methylococcales bacterium]|nr:hypothetical protein [Methylococcales bacterium]
MIALLISAETTGAGSIYKCINNKEKVIFTDKPCGKMKGKLIHQATKKELKVSALKRKRAALNRLIYLGDTTLARRYAKKHQLENVYKEEVDAYNQSLSRKLKQQQLATEKKAERIRHQQLLIQQQALELQKQQLEQQKQQLNIDKALATPKNKYYYPYQPYSPIKPCIGRSLNCQPLINKRYKAKANQRPKQTRTSKKTPNVGYVFP